MKWKWLVVIAFWAALAVAVATGERRVFDTPWLILCLAFAVIGTVKTAHDLVRYFRNADEGKECYLAGGWPRWLGRFICDEQEAAEEPAWKKLRGAGADRDLMSSFAAFRRRERERKDSRS